MSPVRRRLWGAGVSARDGQMVELGELGVLRRGAGQEQWQMRWGSGSRCSRTMAALFAFRCFCEGAGAICSVGGACLARASLQECCASARVGAVQRRSFQGRLLIQVQSFVTYKVSQCARRRDEAWFEGKCHSDAWGTLVFKHIARSEQAQTAPRHLATTTLFLTTRPLRYLIGRVHGSSAGVTFAQLRSCSSFAGPFGAP